jgi:TusA-related sulfurtransferase
MHIEKLDLTGIQRTQAVFKIMLKSTQMKPGDILEVYSISSAFRKDLQQLCERMRKNPVFLEDDGPDVTRCQIRF